MDNWNRNDQEQPNHVMNAQRRLRRRPDETGDSRPDADQPIFAAREPAETAAPEKTTEEMPAAPVKTAEEIPAVPEKPAEEKPDMLEEPAEEKPAASEAPAGDAPETQETAEKTEEPEDAPVVKQAADSRIPPEARRMAAAPYGVPRPDAKRPGTRPQVAPNRPPVQAERRPAVRQPQRPLQARQQLPEDATMVQKPRIRVGYAPGRMAEGITQMVPSQEEPREPDHTRDARAYLEKKRQPFKVEGGGSTPDRPEHKRLRAIVAVLAVIGIVLTGVLFVNNFKKPKKPAGPQVISFDLPDTENRTAPTDLTFSAVTETSVEDIRLSAGNQAVDTEATHVDTTVGRVWMMVMHVREGFNDTVTLQVFRNEEEGWLDTDHQMKLTVEGPIATPTPVVESPAVTATPAMNGEVIFADDEPTPEPEDAEETPEEEPADGEGEPAEEEPVDEYPDESEEEGDSEEEGFGEQEDGSERESDFETVGELRTAKPTATPAPEEAAATVTPPLEVTEAAPEADPGLITNVTVYTGNRKEKNYSRPANDVIHMPVGDEYTNKKLGLMTFRGDNFRRNAAIGTLADAPTKLAILWEVEGGSLRGANQTYYGYGWPGQAAIARWSTQVRANSNLYDSKQEKKALKEVIIAGLDGNIRFLDLQDGSLTRNSIKLGYPMRGTPSLDTRGAPFMTVGQFARKLKSKQGRIGLRQYNLYSQKELKLIDGLDGKNHRPLNDIGSFNTSALIDRISDTVIAIGSNGALYLESLSSNFDFKAGVYQMSPSITLMTSKAQGQKNTALMAVESSPAAYDKYVYYADMGGVLRCVDTNTLQPVWAVDTGDSVMAAVALDLTADRELNLYTANMLNNRRKGDGQVQIRKLDALSGKELWCTEVGVYKGKKDKEDVGAKASPVIGQNGLNGLVFYTVTGLSEEGRTPFGLSEEKAVLLALDKETGKIVWSMGLESRSESSPVAVYDTDGRGWIIQCEQNGTIHLVDGLTGKEINSLQVNGEIEASPAVYSNVMVIGTTGKGTSFIYGIEISNGQAPETKQQEESNEEDSGGA